MQVDQVDRTASFMSSIFYKGILYLAEEEWSHCWDVRVFHSYLIGYNFYRKKVWTNDKLGYGAEDNHLCNIYCRRRATETAGSRLERGVDLVQYCRSSIHGEDTVGDVSGSVNFIAVGAAPLESNPIKGLHSVVVTTGKKTINQQLQQQQNNFDRLCFFILTKISGSLVRPPCRNLKTRAIQVARIEVITQLNNTDLPFQPSEREESVEELNDTVMSTVVRSISTYLFSNHRHTDTTSKIVGSNTVTRTSRIRDALILRLVTHVRSSVWHLT